MGEHTKRHDNIVELQIDIMATYAVQQAATI
jgi:hypothetical protein